MKTLCNDNMHLYKSLLLALSPYFFIIVQSNPTPWQTLPGRPLDWKNDKLEILISTLHPLRDTSDDVMIVASQQIFHENGTLKEIKTIELAIPNPFHQTKPHGKIEHLEELIKYDDDFDDNLLKIQKDFKTVYEDSGYQQAVAYRKVSVWGETELEMYVNKDAAYVEEDDSIGYYLRDNLRRPSSDIVKEQLEARLEDSPKTTLLSLLRWDHNHQLLKNESNIQPKLLAYVDEASDDAEEGMMDTALEALSKYALTDPENIPKELSGAMSHSHPEYSWIVTKWQEEVVDNAKHDIFIKLTYDNVKPGEPMLEYTVYGVKK